jgi:threonylcarbamoyladenosine tRNA methylthiotransferase MtaB
MTDPKPAQGCSLGFITLGCKVNQYESAFMAESAVNAGFMVSSPENADFLVINTCTVTSRTDRQIRQILRHAARQSPQSKLIVTGCYAQRAPADLAEFPNVLAVLGNHEKALWPHFLLSRQDTGKPVIQVSSLSDCRRFAHMPLEDFRGHTRAFLKIQDGCENFCSYCVVPLVRGPERSLPILEVEKQIQVFLSRGYKEIVLTGINLSRFGRDLPGDINLLTLIRRLKETRWPARFRLSSVEPLDLSYEVLAGLAGWSTFCPHFHIPLQSGSAAVLTAMGRKYRPEDFEDLIRQISVRFPRAAIGLDVMVGFPTESPADFRQTRQLLERLPVSYLHVFPYSARPGTPAARMRPIATSTEVQERAKNLRALGLHKKLSFYQSQLGTIADILVEGKAAGDSGWITGLSDNYLRVQTVGDRSAANQVIQVRLQEMKGQALIAAKLR